MIAFIDTYRDQFGVEFICRILRGSNPGVPYLPRVSGSADPPGLRSRDPR